MPKSDDGDGGFTLIELMVVVLVIAILLAIAIPTFLGARTRSQDAAARSAVRNAGGVAAARWSATGTWPTSPADMAAEDPSLTFTSGPSTGPRVVSMTFSATGGSLAVRSTSGRCIVGTLSSTGLAVTDSGTGSAPCQTVVGVPVTTGLIAWYDGADAGAVALSGSTVASWTDKSGNNNTASASIGTVSYVTAAQNGQNALRFNGASTLLAPNSTSLSLAGSGLTIAVAYTASNVGGAYAFINKESTWEVGETGAGAGWTAAVQGGCWTWVGNYPVARNQWHTTTFRYSPAWLFTVDSGPTQTATAPCSGNISPTTNGLTLGGRGNGGTPSLTGDLGEVLIWNRALSDAENDQVRAYLTAKWGTP